ncbi:unnamed protein product [Caenorhabditis bovis]|uniref:Uncharacterized protein n=1 Tax=Caenorhabditis bovis TaxID=2654633 RepID=A0A8S1F5Z7_9PELO|nr:unnamed protein product [Caenorhabditis bovis]
MEWTNPSLRESAEYTPATAAFMTQGQNTVIQYLTQSARNATILAMEYQCQSVINSCSFQGVQMSSFDCCRNLIAYVPTIKGLCFTWRDANMWQNSTGINRRFEMTRNFQFFA